MNAQFILNCLYSVANAPFALYDAAHTPHYFMPDTLLFRNLASLVPASLWQTESNAAIVSVAEFLNFGMIRLSEDQIVVFGPFTEIPCERTEAKHLLARLGDKETDFLTVINFFSMHAAGSVPQMGSLLDLVNHIFHGEQPSVLDQLRGTPATSTTPAAPQAEESSHNTEYYETRLYSYIEQGQPEMLENFRIKGQFAGMPGNVANDYMRKYKNLLISSVTLASRAAVRGGLDYDTAMYMADTYMRTVERTFDLNSLGQLNTTMLIRYAQMVQKCRLGNSDCKLVFDVDNYILRHINTRITGDMIASHLKMNRSYLCRRFKSETGVSVGDHIQIIKIEESKRLLSTNEYSILDIALMMDYASQSSFHRAFKSYTGVTPKAWQDSLLHSKNDDSHPDLQRAD
jgi:AraC-like DNA-binding protein